MQHAVNSALLAPKVPGGVYGEQDDSLVFVCTRTNQLLLMNLTGQVMRSFSSGKKEKGDFVAMLASPKGDWLYACAEDHRLYCFSTESGSLEQTLKVADKEVIGLAHHPYRNILACFSSGGVLA